MNLLIVDDDPTNLKLLRAQLEAEGHVVFEAHDGVDALALLERQRVDVVISDILMPRMDGYRLCHEIRKHARLHDLPIILYTSTYTSPSDEKLVLDVGADKYLKKPASVETLVAALHEVIAKPHAGPRPEALQEIEVLKEYSERLVSKLAEKNSELIASEVKFRSLVEQSIVGIYITQDDQFVYVNPMMAKIFGRSEEEMTSRTLYDFIVPEDHALVRENIRKQTSGKVQNIHYYLRMLHQSGAVLQVEIHGNQTDYNGRPAAMGMLVDITDRKHAEEETQRERAFFDQLVETAPEGIAISDTQGRVLRVNAEFVRMFGYGVDEVVGQCLDDLVAPPARQEEARALTASATQGTEILLETVRHKKDGTLVDVSLISAPILVAGKQEAVYAIYRDITGRKQADEALKESEDRFRAIFDQAAVGVALLNTKTGQYVRINQKYCDLVGYTMQEMLQKSFMDITFDQDIHENVDKNAQLMEGKAREFSFEKRYVHKDGHLVWGNLTISPLWKSGDKPQTYFHIAVVENITERKQAEAQLRQSQKMEAIGQLAGGVAHDFNNLLTGILGNIALMRSSLPPADPLLENLNAAESAARHAADLTKKLLTFSRSAMVLPVPMKIADALDATLAILKQSLPATMEIVRDYEQTAWNVLLDQSQMTQILLNLAVNARDAMKGKGMLTIRARNEVVGEKYVQTHPFARTGEFVHLSVTDTGPGMSSEVMQHLFEPFYTTKPIGSGTGLGLSVVYGAVKQVGGWITAVSTEGVGRTTPRIERTSSGATFDIYLPRCLEEPVQSVTPSPLPVNTGSGTVLVVEDEPVVCTVAQALLSRSGYTVLTAPDGASALNILREHPAGIGLILLDMTMPGMTNGEVVQAIRVLDRKVPILLNSGYASNGVVKQMLAEDSVQGFLGKPYDLDQLLNTINQLMKRT